VNSSSTLEAFVSSLSPAQLAGQLLVVGFEGQTLPAALAASLEAGERAGVILFRRNLIPGESGLHALQLLCARIARQSLPELPPLISIDEEGGRVTRLSPPALALPAMRRIAELRDVSLLERVGRALGNQLRCLGLTMDFAPVVDVDTNPDNPIIGDRAFACDAEQVALLAGAFMTGLRSSGIQACLKHFPGHGDTLLDSHLALPTVAHGRERLEAVELLPFRCLAAEADSMMTAHVLYPALDSDCPATLSRRIATELLRRELSFDGVLFSDDLEMRALGEHGSSIEDSAVGAIRAGCDLLLVCSRADDQARVHAALVKTLELDAGFRERCVVAAARGLAMRRKSPPKPASPEELSALMRLELRPLESELAERLAAHAPVAPRATPSLLSER
jgi:beta-N-acetylhexosaminidase